VNEHGDIEVAGREALDDVGEMHADFVADSGVFGVVGRDVNGAACFVDENDALWFRERNPWRGRRGR
jgi:hypothetical protein